MVHIDRECEYCVLKGKEHDPSRTLWIRLPMEAERMLGIQSSDVLMRLRKPIYDLVDAPRAWFREAHDRLSSINFRAHALDQCLFTWHDSQDLDPQGLPKLVCLLGLYVDDLRREI